MQPPRSAGGLTGDFDASQPDCPQPTGASAATQSQTKGSACSRRPWASVPPRWHDTPASDFPPHEIPAADAVSVRQTNDRRNTRYVYSLGISGSNNRTKITRISEFLRITSEKVPIISVFRPTPPAPEADSSARPAERQRALCAQRGSHARSVLPCHALVRGIESSYPLQGRCRGSDWIYSIVKTSIIMQIHQNL